MQGPWLTEPQKLNSTGPAPSSSHGWYLRISCKGSLFPNAGFTSVKRFHISYVAVWLTFEWRGCDMGAGWGCAEHPVNRKGRVQVLPNTEHKYLKDRAWRSQICLSVKATTLKGLNLRYKQCQPLPGSAPSSLLYIFLSAWEPFVSYHCPLERLGT